MVIQTLVEVLDIAAYVRLVPRLVSATSCDVASSAVSPRHIDVGADLVVGFGRHR